MDCAVSGTWTYNASTKRLRHTSGKCLTLVSVDNGHNVVHRAVAKQCVLDRVDEDQKWEIKQYNRRGLKYKNLLQDKRKN